MQADAQKELDEARAAVEAEASLASSSTAAGPSSDTGLTKLEGKGSNHAMMSSEAAPWVHIQVFCRGMHQVWFHNHEAQTRP